jgi:SRSO17 transposase
MTNRRSCPPAPGPLEAYAQRLDPLFSSLAQRRGLRDYLQGLLLPRDRNKTLTGLASAEPIVGAQHREVQRLQWFLSESTWDHQQVNDQRVRLLCQDSATAPNDRGALVIDDTGDRKDGTATAHVARQYLGSVGKVDNGIVAVTSLWADERCYWPVHAVPYTPAVRLPGGERDPGFHTKPQLAVELVQAAQQAGIRFRAVVADCFYGDNPGFTGALGAAKVRFVLALKPRRGTWAPADQAHTPVEAAGELGWRGPPDRDAGDASSVVSATATPRPGGRPTPSSAAGARIGGCGWWWPPPTPAAARARDLVSADQPAVSPKPPRPAGRPG